MSNAIFPVRIFHPPGLLGTVSHGGLVVPPEGRLVTEADLPELERCGWGVLRAAGVPVGLCLPDGWRITRGSADCPGERVLEIEPIARETLEVVVSAGDDGKAG